MMTNPWTNITWNNTVADCDKYIINPAYCAEHGIDISNLPEPYTGNIDSNVVCLNLNPGISKCDPCFRFDEVFLSLTQKTLCHNINHSFWIDDDIKCKYGGLHEGCEWWRNKTKELRKAVPSKPLNIFVLEYFPYHTTNTIKFPKLPSDEYRNELLKRAIDANKLIIIMRSKQLWCDITDPFLRDVGSELDIYKNKIILSNARNPCFTKKNIGSRWTDLISKVRM